MLVFFANYFEELFKNISPCKTEMILQKRHQKKPFWPFTKINELYINPYIKTSHGSCGEKKWLFPYFYMLRGTLHNKSVPSFENRWEPFSIREPFRNPLSVIVWKKRKSSVYGLRRHLLPQRFIVIDFVHASHNFFQAYYDLLEFVITSLRQLEKEES